jgi:uncharacterized protein YecE (DUF72 family)
MTEREIVRVGPAGWNYRDWYGSVYPDKTDKNFKELDYLVQYFDTAEINSTFYHPANVYMAKAWAKKAEANPRFKFTAKLWQRFTHERQVFGSGEVRQVTAGMDPLASADRLGAVLVQFPWSFKNDDTGRAWIASVLDAFRQYPLVVEVRHSSWDVPAFYESLDRRGVGFAAIDQPVIGNSLSLKAVRTGDIGYVRMHGRNYRAWFAKGGEKAEPSGRYDYLYTEKEIREIAGTVRAVAKETKETYVVQNNHPRGQAAANAMQLRAELGETILKFPGSLLEKFPQLKEIVKKGS